jgi:very-short-patch-repair endonuclease
MFEHVGHGPGAVGRSRGLKRRMTWSEKKLWPELQKLNANFRRQAPIGRYFADFACHARKLIVELDGEIHERVAEVALRDMERQQWLEAEGYRVLRFTNKQIDADVHGCAEEVKALLLDGGGLGGGVAAEVKGPRRLAPTPNGAARPNALLTPPSPALPPSRRKGEGWTAPPVIDRKDA